MQQLDLLEFRVVCFIEDREIGAVDELNLPDVLWLAVAHLAGNEVTILEWRCDGEIGYAITIQVAHRDNR